MQQVALLAKNYGENALHGLTHIRKNDLNLGVVRAMRTHSRDWLFLFLYNPTNRAANCAKNRVNHNVHKKSQNRETT